MPIKKKRRTRRPVSRRTYAVFFFLFTILVCASHAAFFDLPFYWDEGGRFIPAALDLYHSGALLPRSIPPDAHPPGVMAYLAAVWSVAGYSIIATRAAMMLVAGASVLVVFLLAVRLLTGVKGAPAFTVVLLLLVTPVFYTQAMMAQLDMPAMLFTLLAVLLYVEDKPLVAALACAALAMTRETGVVTALILGLGLAAQARMRQAAWFLLAPMLLGLWLLYVYQGSGHFLGAPYFTELNVEYLWHPARMAFAIVKRLYFLFWEDLRFIGAFAILYALIQGNVYVGREWRLAAVLVLAHVLMFSVVGGAMLERYMLPVLPLVFIAMVAGLCALPNPWKVIGQAGLITGALAGIFWNPPYPFPFENNLAFTEFVKLHQTAAEYIEQRYPSAEISTAWPLSDELRKPELGYVPKAHRVRSIRNFTEYAVSALEDRPVELFVLFSRQWDPPINLLRSPIAAKIWSWMFPLEAQISSLDVDTKFKLKTVAAWSNHGQWIEVHAPY